MEIICWAKNKEGMGKHLKSDVQSFQTEQNKFIITSWCGGFSGYVEKERRRGTSERKDEVREQLKG